MIQKKYINERTNVKQILLRSSRNQPHYWPCRCADYFNYCCMTHKEPFHSSNTATLFGLSPKKVSNMVSMQCSGISRKWRLPTESYSLLCLLSLLWNQSTFFFAQATCNWDAIEMFSLFFLTALAPVKIIKHTSNLELLPLGSTGSTIYYIIRCGFWKRKDMSGYQTACILVTRWDSCWVSLIISPYKLSSIAAHVAFAVVLSY